MNICLVTSSFLPNIGGRELVVHNLATALINLGHNVIVVTPYRKNLNFGINYNYIIVRFGFRGSGRLRLTVPLAVFTLARIVQRLKIDIINIHNVYIPGSWAYYFSRIFKKTPVIGTPHGDDIQIFPELQYGVRLNPKCDKIVQRNVKCFTRVTAISESIRKKLSEILMGEQNIRDVPNGIWISNLQQVVDKIKLRKKYGVPLNSIALISVGRNHPIKGYKLGVEAVAKLCNAGTKISYIVVGRDMSSVIENARTLGISNSLITPGELSTEEVAKLLQISDIYINPSFIESFGLTTVEAMSAGLPCIVSNVPGNMDIVSSEYGELVESGNSQQLADAIKYLIENPTIRKKKGIRARIEAQRYDWVKIAEMYVNVYREAIDEYESYFR